MQALSRWNKGKVRTLYLVEVEGLILSLATPALAAFVTLSLDDISLVTHGHQ